MKKRILNIILTLTLFVTGLHITAQTFPVQVIPQVTPPPPVYLSDYASTNNSADRVRAQVLLTDLTVLNREVRLKLYIEGNGINTQSRDFIVGAQPIFLDGGIPVQLGSIDLAPYFELQNLQGISAGAYANEMPEGLYQFCFEVYDVLSGNRISNKSCTNVLIFLNDPPFLNLPENNINLEAYNPQNILFQWTPRHINVSNVEYEFSLVEIWDTNIDPQAIFLSSPPIYQITTQTTTLLYGLSEPQLLEGKRYAWRVKAQALDGIDEIGLFKNNGYSEIFSFTYQGECNAPSYLTVEEVGTKTATFKWQGEIDYTQYKIDYRKAIDENGNTGDQNTFQWFESTTNRDEFIVIDLEPNTMYEWRVGGYCADGTLSFAESSTFTTMAEEAEAYYNCGIEPTINIANQLLLDELQVGDVIKAGDFNVKIQEVSGTNSFSGKGYTTVGFLKNIKIALEFSNIQVNTDYQFVSGEIKTVYDPTWSNILDVDEVIDEFEDIVDVFTGDDIVIITLDYDITVSDITVDADSGQIIVNNPNGSPSTFDYDTGDIYTITDASGDQFEIDANGNVTQTGTGAEGGPATADNTFGITNGHDHTIGDPSVRTIEKHPIAFTYRKGSNTKYELDVANNNYENEKYHKVTIDGGGSYYPVHKAIVEGGDTDHFYVDVNNVSTYIKTDSLIFKTVSGTKVDAVKEGTNSYKITVKGRNSYANEEAIITFKDSIGKQHILSSFFIHHIKKFPTINVNVVLINGATDIDGLQAKLDAIYKPTGVSFNVGSTETLTISQADWDVDIANAKIDYNGSGLASDHPKELRAIKDYYKNQNSGYDNKAYHLFVLDDSMSVTKALAGFMPKKNQWGFLFEAHYSTNIQNKGTVSTIAAHELGHGVFALGHPFGEDENKSGTASTWLMDYTNGTELAYPNWAKMSDDSLQLHLFQDDQDNEFGAYEHLIGFNVIPNSVSTHIGGENISFVSSAGKIITIPSSAKDVTFNSKGALFAFTITENGKQERYISAKWSNDKTFAGYLKKLTNGKDWNNAVYKDDESRKLLESNDNAFVYLGVYEKSNGSCGINLFQGKYPNEVDKDEWNSGGNRIPFASTSTIKSKLKIFSDGNATNKPYGDKTKLIESKIASPEACNSCTEGDKFIDDYKEISDTEILEKIIQISYLICDSNADPDFFSEFSTEGYNNLLAWQKTFYDNGDWGTDLEAFNGFYKAYEAYINYYKASKEIIKTSDDRKALLRIAYNFKPLQLKSLPVNDRVRMLKIISSSFMTGFWTSTDYNIEALALKIIRSIDINDDKILATEFLDALLIENTLSTLLNKIDGDNFKELVFHISSLVFQHKPKPNYSYLESQDFFDENGKIYNNHIFHWKEEAFVKDVVWHSNTKSTSSDLKITYDYDQWFDNTPQRFLRDISPYEFIGVNAPYGLTYLGLTSDKDKFFVMPAILFHWMTNENDNDQMWQNIKTSVDIGLTLFSLGEYTVAKTALGRAFAVANIAIPTVDILINNSDLQNEPEYEDFISTWNTVYTTYAVVTGIRVIYQLNPDKFKKFTDFFDTHKNTIKNNITDPVKYNKLESAVEEIKQINAANLANVGVKLNLLSKLDNFTSLKTWVNGLDDVVDANLITKLDALDVTDLGKLNTDLTHNVYGAEIKILLKESPDDLTNIWRKLKYDPAYSWEIQKTGGSRWEKWGQREFFKDITKKGKDFEELICKQAFKNRSSAKYLELKQQFQADFGKNLDDYDMFSQVQLKYNNTGDYFVADQVFVKYDAFDDIEDLIVIENKLSRSTPFSPNQTSALHSNSFTIRSNSIASDTNPNLLLESANNETLSFSDSKQWYKVSSSGDGTSIINIQKIQ